MGSARRLAVDGDEIVPPRPQRRDPALEAAAKQGRIDPVHEAPQPALAWNAVMEVRKLPQKMQVMLAPGNDIVEVVTRGDAGAGHKQQGPP
jgi:hypothetical protein